MPATKSRERLFFSILLAATLLLGFWLRTENLNKYPPGISNDEAVNVIDAFHIWQTGNFPLYQDQGRPEPLFRLFQAVGIGLFGEHNWSVRFVGALFGVLTLAAAYWAATECLHDQSKRIRRLASWAAAISLTVAIGHITVTRSTYRAIPQPLFMFLSIGFLMRGLRQGNLRDFALSGFFIALSLYTYTAAYVIPIAFFPLTLHLFIFRMKQWQIWFPRLLLVGFVTAIFMLPVILILLDSPENVLGRATAVSESTLDFAERIEVMIHQFISQGDENPQYNVALTPLLPRLFMPLFALGLLGLLARFRHPSSVFIASLLILASIPALATNEITHGLRVIGEFAAFPLIIAVGVTLILAIANRITGRQSVILTISLALLGTALIVDSLYGRQTYIDYWENADAWNLWRIHGKRLEHGEWFFRTDRRDFTAWLKAHQKPLLLPVDELIRPSTRSWLLNAYPNVKTADETFVLPQNTEVVIPWDLSTDDLRLDTNRFALLHESQITLLPPVSEATQQVLISDIETYPAIIRESGDIRFLGHNKPLPANFELRFEAKSTQQSVPVVATYGGDELELVGWRGIETLERGIQFLPITLEWSANKQIGHEYAAYVQLLTQDWQRISGDEHLILRWLYPTSVWQADDIVPDQYTLEIPDNLHPGAYRLIAGVYYGSSEPIQAISHIGQTVQNSATIGWIKVPQASEPEPGENAIPIQAILNDQFALNAIEAELDETNQATIKLYWQSVMDRPNIDATVFVHLLDTDGTLIAQSDIRPWNGQYPTFIWSEGEHVVTEHILDISGLELDTLTMTAGMYTHPDFTRLRVVQDGEENDRGIVVLGNAANILGK